MDEITVRPGVTPFASSALPDGRFSLPDRALALVPGLDKLPPVILQQDSLFLSGEAGISNVRRLVVCLPAGGVDEAVLARRIWQLAASSGLNVLYVTLVPKENQAASQHRRLAELSILSGDRAVRARGEVSRAKSWLPALKDILQPGDLLVCLAGHQVKEGFAHRVSLGWQLAERLSCPVYVLGGVRLVTTPSRWQRIKELRAWATSVAIIVGFFFLQVGIDHSATRPASTIMLCLSALAEIYSLMQFNEWIG